MALSGKSQHRIARDGQLKEHIMFVNGMSAGAVEDNYRLDAENMCTWSVKSCQTESHAHMPLASLANRFLSLHLHFNANDFSLTPWLNPR